VKTTPIKISKRTTPSVYRGNGGLEGFVPLLEKLVGNDDTNKRIFFGIVEVLGKKVLPPILDIC
jgi:hypothetical protein